jgi:hypothetical protein
LACNFEHPHYVVGLALGNASANAADFFDLASKLACNFEYPYCVVDLALGNGSMNAASLNLPS